MPATIPAQELKMTPELETLIGEWFESVNKLSAAKARENQLRLALYDLLVPADDKRRSEEGTDRFAMPGGWHLDIDRKLNCRIDETILATVQQEIKELPPTEDGEIVSIDAAVVFKPKITAAYKHLPDVAKEILNKALTWTPGTPGMALELPKSRTAKATAKKTEDAT
jgi:hypothetical protein